MTTKQILEIVADVTGVPVASITGRRRTDRVSCARHLAVASIRHNDPRLSLQETAEAVGKSCHGTTVNSMQRHSDMIETDIPYLTQFNAILRRILTTNTKKH